ncbi:MAG: hypothetical protein ACLP2P_02765 [Desulfobaccales bacterium]
MSIIKVEGLNISKSIIVQTRQGNNILNEQLFTISSFEQNQFPEYIMYVNAKFRTKPTAIYNCHGLTFASKRTNIFDVDQLFKILEEDRYFEIASEDILPGDIILYFSPEGDIEHSGVVIREPDAYLKIPQIYSKWGKYCEAIHFANNCPYDFSNVKYYRCCNETN